MTRNSKKGDKIFIVLIIMLVIGIGLLGCLIHNTSKDVEKTSTKPKKQVVEPTKIDKNNSTSDEKDIKEEAPTDEVQTEKVEVPATETKQNQVENTPKSYNVSSIELIGDEVVTVIKGEKYIDKGAKAVDESGNDVSNQIKVDNTVDTSKTGEYTVTYSIGNFIVIRRVIVK